MKSLLRKILCLGLLLQGGISLASVDSCTPVPSASVSGPTSVALGSTVTYTIAVSGGFVPEVVITIPNKGSAGVPYRDPIKPKYYKVDVYWFAEGSSVVKVHDESEVYSATSSTITISSPSVGVITISGGVSSRCQGGGTTTFSASAQYATSYSWSIAPRGAGSISNGTVTWSPSFNGAATIYVTAYGNGGSSSSNSTNVNVSTPNVVTISSNQPSTICQGDYAILSVAGVLSYNEWEAESTEGTLRWYSTTSISVSPNVTTTYTFYGTTSTCPTAVQASFVIYVTPLPTIPGEINPSEITTRCQGNGSNTFSAIAYNSSSSNWWITPEAGSINPNGNVTWNSGFSGDATIIFSALGCNGSGASKSKVITVYPLPTAAASNQTLCSSQATSIIISNPNSVPGTTYNWTVSSGAVTGASNSSGSLIAQTLVNSTLSPINVIYTITPQANGCNGPAINATVMVNPNPLAPVVNGASRCGTGSVTLSGTPGTNGNTLKWYTNTSTTTPLYTGTSYSPSVSATTTYYVSSFNTTTLCESANPRVAVTATVNPIPSLPTPVSGSRCEPGTVSLSASSGSNGNNVRWYAAPTGGSPIATSLTYTPYLTTTTTYYISSYNSTTLCEGSRTPITATVKPLPPAPLVTGNERFGPGTFSLVATGGDTYTWYDPSNNVVSSQALYSTPSISATTTNYAYVISTVNGCASPPTWVTLNVYSDIIITATSNAVVMNENVTMDAGFDYTTFDWRKGGTTLGSNRYLDTNIPGDYTVTVSYGSISKTSPVFVLSDQFGGQNKNFIVSSTLQVPIQNAIAIKDLQIGLNNQTVQYMDGLGRSLQSIVTQGSPSKKDIVQPVAYDEYGRESKKYSPYVSSTQSGRFNIDPLGAATSYTNSAQFSFYNNGNGDKIADDSRPFSETIFEASPLNRPTENFGVGADWYSNGKSIKLNYLINVHGIGSGQEQIIAWKVDVASELPVRITQVNSYTSGGYFTSGQLSIKSTMDEQGREVREYTNKQGQVILKKVQYVEAATLSNKDHWAQTYYIYDKLGQLRYVLQPELSKILHASGTTNPTAAQLDNWIFQYKYDGRKRMTHKKVPGADWVYMVYDNRDRLVMTQDGEQRKTNQWSFTKYDQLNRPVMTGIYTHGLTVDQYTMQTTVNDFYTAAASNTDEWFEVAGSALYGYTDQSFPKSVAANDYLTVTYYDTYNVSDTWGDSYAYEDLNLTGTFNSITYNQPSNRSVKTIGQVTASMVKNLADNTWLKSVNYYDEKYRVVQGVADNQLSGVDRNTSVYDFVEKVLLNQVVHMDGAINEHIVTRTFDYDHAGRLIDTWHKIDNAEDILLAHNEYNELGQLVDKKLHSVDNGTSYRQSVDYRYNIRGWLISMNNAALSTDPATNDDAGDLFGMELGYNNSIGTGNHDLYNGNISGIKWSTNMGLGAVKQHAYNYGYDPMNRIKSADFHKNTGSWAPSHDFQVSGFDYDLNGNIKALSRKDDKGVDMDVLTYNYGDNETLGNQLRWVSDAAPGQKGFVDGNISGDDYLYDANGNMTVDKNKNITAITYNHLNLPEKVTKGTGEYIKYIYDASGRKLSQQVYAANNGLKKTTDYVGEYVYENDTLRFINTEEGRVIPPLSSGEGEGGEVEYQYHLKDHLGNIRVTFTTKDEQEENTATLEIANEVEERSQFLYYDDVRFVNSDFFDKTKDGQVSPPEGAYALRLNGTENEKTGLAKSLVVVPGDKVQLEVYAKYVDPDASNWTTALTNLMAAVADPSSVPGTVLDGAGYAYGGSNQFAYGGLLDKSGEMGVGPKAYLNYLVFDLDFVPQLGKSGYRRLSDTPKETGTNVAHEKLDWEIDITEPGYVYIWLSNDEVVMGGTPVEVYFDEFKVTHIKSPVIQSDEYYPFGLRYNSYSRENSTKNRFLFQGQEHIDDLDLNWDSFKWRNHQPDIGRFFNIDPLAESYYYNSPYAFSENKVTAHVELEGLEAESIKKLQRSTAPSSYTSTLQRSGQNIGVISFNKSTDVYSSTTIKLPQNAKQSQVSDQSATVMGELANSTGEKNPRISSIARDAKGQAVAMFQNAEGFDQNGNKVGVTGLKADYGTNGDIVADVYGKGKAMQGLASQFGGTVTNEQIIGMMERKINELGVSNVTNHAADPNVLQVFDIAPTSIVNDTAFKNKIVNSTGQGKPISWHKFPGPGSSEKGYHVEIPQKRENE